MAVSKRLRFEILRRDNHACRYCGRSAPEVQLTVDHVTPVALGGTDSPENLVTACTDCNGGKSSIQPGSSLVEDVDADATRWAAAIKEVAERRRESDIEIRKWFTKVWYTSADGLLLARRADGSVLYRLGPASLYTDPDSYPEMHTIEAPPRPANWPTSIANFIAAGLSRQELIHFVAVAMQSHVSRKQKWSYFCGCCWNLIRDLQNEAAQLIKDEERSQ